MKIRLVTKWEETRYQQEDIILKNEEKDLNEELNETQNKINIEMRAINDIDSELDGFF